MNIKILTINKLLTKVVALGHEKTRASYTCVMRTIKDKEKGNPNVVKVALTMVFEL